MILYRLEARHAGDRKNVCMYSANKYIILKSVKNEGKGGKKIKMS